MENLYIPRKVVEFVDPWSKLDDSTDLVLSIIGKVLIIVFFLPIVIIAGNSAVLMFPNLAILVDKGAVGMLKFQALYPLLAGAGVVYLSRKERSLFRALSLLEIAVLPLLVLLLDKDVRVAFAAVGNDITGSMSLQLQSITAALGTFGMLAGAHAVRVKPKNNIAPDIAVIGGCFFFLSLLIPVQGKFTFLEPFALFSREDPAGAGSFFVIGSAAILSILFMILAAVLCLRIREQEKDSDKEMIGIRIIRLWVWHFLVYGFAVYYMLFAGIIMETDMSGTLLAVFTTGFLKFIPWILGLYVLVPLAIAELLLLSPLSFGIRRPKGHKKF